MIDTSIFKNLKADENKLKNYGFTKNDNAFSLSKNIHNNDYKAIFKITNLSNIDIDVYDNETNEKLDLFYFKDGSGSFIGEINSACNELANDILICCFERDVFKSKQAISIINYIKTAYNDELEFLWPKLSQTAIWRRKDNKKWYGILFTLTKDKLKFESKEQVEIIDLRVDKNQISSIIDGEHILEGYHMNKKSWITIILDGSIKTEKIISLVNESYKLAKK